MSGQSALKCILMTFLSLLLTVVFFPLAAAPMLMCRRLCGRARFCVQQGAFAVMFLSMGHMSLMIAWLSLSVLAFFLEEALLKSHSLFAAGFYSVLAGLFTATGLFVVFNASDFVGALAKIKLQTQQLIEKSTFVTNYLQQYKIEMDTIIAQVPSMVVILFIGAASLALLLGRSGSSVETQKKIKLNSFAVPNEFIFVLLFALAGSFITVLAQVSWVPIVATNILNICVVVYALQGAAIVSKFFELYKISLFWRIFSFFILLVQLPIVLSFVGFMDYWFNFRFRFQRKVAAREKEWRKQ